MHHLASISNLFMVVGILALACAAVFTIYALIWFGAYLWERWRFRKEPVEDWTQRWEKAKEVLKAD